MSTTITEYPTFQKMKKIHISWTSGEAGFVATGTTTNYYTGTIVKAMTVPDGVAVPLNNYDITIKDSASLDLGAGLLINRSNTATEVVSAGLGSMINSQISIRVESAGASKKGVLILWVK